LPQPFLCLSYGCQRRCGNHRLGRGREDGKSASLQIREIQPGVRAVGEKMILRRARLQSHGENPSHPNRRRCSSRVPAGEQAIHPFPAGFGSRLGDSRGPGGADYAGIRGDSGDCICRLVLQAKKTPPPTRQIVDYISPGCRGASTQKTSPSAARGQSSPPPRGSILLNTPLPRSTVSPP